jgi:hypothetical protein
VRPHFLPGDVLSHAAVVDFSLSASALVDRLLDAIVMAEAPGLAADVANAASKRAETLMELERVQVRRVYACADIFRVLRAVSESLTYLASELGVLLPAG